LIKAMTERIEAIDNSHVKEIVASRAPATGAGDRYSAMFTTWTAFAALQPYRPYSRVPRSREPQERRSPRAAGRSTGWLDAAGMRTH